MELFNKYDIFINITNSLLNISINDKTITLDFVQLNEMLIQTQNFLSKIVVNNNILFIDNNANKYAFSVDNNTNILIWFEDSNTDIPPEEPIITLSKDVFLQIMSVLNNIKNNYFVIIILEKMYNSKQNNTNSSINNNNIINDIATTEEDKELLDMIEATSKDFENKIGNKIK